MKKNKAGVSAFSASRKSDTTNLLVLNSSIILIGSEIVQKQFIQMLHSDIRIILFWHICVSVNELELFITLLTFSRDAIWINIKIIEGPFDAGSDLHLVAEKTSR